MHRMRTLTGLFCCALMAAMLGVPSISMAATVTPPTLSEPAASVSDLEEGKSVTFEWSGSLQGDASQRDRSFFRVEIAATEDVPSGTQSTWSTLEASMQTNPGETETSVTLGVPAAGSYRWRVCAWGVADATVSETIEQLSGGCSGSRPFTTTAAASTTGTGVGQITMEEKTIVDGETKTVYVEREVDDPAETTSTVPAQTSSEDRTEVKDVFVPATFSALKPRSGSSSDASGSGGTNEPASSVDLGDDGLDLDLAADKAGGISGAFTGGLSSTLPLVPIPFWTLALMLACLPIAHAWRRSVLAMFDQPDETDVSVLARIPLAPTVKAAARTADAEEPATRAGGRHAA